MATIAAARNIPAARPRSAASPATSRPANSAPNGGQTRRAARPTNPLSERTTAQLIRKILVPQDHSAADQLTAAALEGQLPPLTTSNEVDFQLYALLSIILRDFVQSWYGRITPDEMFVKEIVNVIAHITTVMEQRIRRVDLESLVLDEIPDLLERHVVAYRASKNPVTRAPIEANNREIYHSLFPSPAMSPVPDPTVPHSASRQKKNEAGYRKLLVQGMLLVLLRTEDLQNSCLISLVGEILSETIIGNLVSNKLSQPWMLWEILNIICNHITGKKAPQKDKDQKSRKGSKSPPETSETVAAVSPSPKVPFRQRWSFQALIVILVQWGFTVYSLIRGTIDAFNKVRSLPSRLGHDLYAKPSQTNNVDKVPITTFKLFSLAATLIELEQRMPWLSGNIAMVQWGLLKGPWRIGALDGILDRYLAVTIQTTVFDSSRVPSLLRSIRGALYPDNLQGKSSLSPPTNTAEENALRLRTASALASLMPKWMLRSYFCGGAWRPAPDLQISEGNMDPNRNTDQRVVAEIDETIVDVFSDEYCNKHLMYAIVELVLARLMPELSEKGVEELLSDRLGV